MAALLPPSSRMARAKRAARRGPTCAAHGGRAGGGHDRHARVVDEDLADLAAADQHLRQALRARRRSAPRRALDEGLRRQRRERGLLGRLPDHRIAADEGQRRVPGPHRDGEVEGRDDAADAERMPGLHHAVVRRARWRWSGRRAGATGRRRSRRCRSSPATSPRPSERILPASSVTSRPRSSLAARSSSPRSRTNSPRRGAGTLRQARNALWARRDRGLRLVGRGLAHMGDHLAGDRRAGRQPVRGQRAFGNAEPVQDRQRIVAHRRRSGLRHRHGIIPGLKARPRNPEPRRGTAAMQPRRSSIQALRANATLTGPPPSVFSPAQGVGVGANHPSPRT